MVSTAKIKVSRSILLSWLIQEPRATHFQNPFVLMAGPNSQCGWNSQCSAVTMDIRETIQPGKDIGNDTWSDI